MPTSEPPEFRGCYSHNLDAKGRTSLPSDFRSTLERVGGGDPFLAPTPKSIALYPHEAWRAMEQRLVAAPNMNPAVQRLRRFLIGYSSPCPVDGQGRILVPPRLREHAQLSKKVVIVGVGSTIEIWDRARYDADVNETITGYDELYGVFERLDT